MQSNRWLTWEPSDRGLLPEDDRVIEKTPQTVPTKPTKPHSGGSNGFEKGGFDGFVGSPQGENPITRDTHAKGINGHRVAEIVWETPRVIVFRDPQGMVWRRVHSWGMTWPITFGKNGYG